MGEDDILSATSPHVVHVLLALDKGCPRDEASCSTRVQASHAATGPLLSSVPKRVPDYSVQKASVIAHPAPHQRRSAVYIPNSIPPPSPSTPS